MKPSLRSLTAAALLSVVPSAFAIDVTSPAFDVSLTLTSSCSITAAPGTITLAYTSFQGGNASGTTSFDVKCTDSKPYTIAFDNAAGTIAGINYGLTLSNGGAGTGSGADQTVTITATALGNQGGTCAAASCNGTQSHTVTVTY